jgi:glycyl-tRNA synthetase
LRRSFFYAPSFDIYGGCAGFYDFGPLGSALKQNIEGVWRNHFILEEDMLELTTTNITLDKVLQVSGHVAKFADFMVTDVKAGNPYRADKLIHEHCEKVIAKKGKKMKPEEKEKYERIIMECENYDAEQLNECIKTEKIKSPDTGNELTEAVTFNLMFQT